MKEKSYEVALCATICSILGLFIPVLLPFAAALGVKSWQHPLGKLGAIIGGVGTILMVVVLALFAMEAMR